MDALARCARPESAPIEGEHELFGFLTTEANAIVAPIHPKAMPVILRSAEKADRWLEADTPVALALQRPLPDTAFKIVAKGEKEDGDLRRPAVALARVTVLAARREVLRISE
jgi:putative SOS response-associated peptidase YedK